MEWLHCTSYLFGGAFLSNAIPHFVSGVLGRPYQTPFATLSSQALSSPTVALGYPQLRGFLCPDLSSRKVQLTLYDSCGGPGTAVSSCELVECAPLLTLSQRQLPRGFK
jgi:hypothetical protein